MLNQIKRNQVNAVRSIDVTISGTVDPTVTAVDAKAGTRYNQIATPFASFVKLDDGATTNWQKIGGAITTPGENVYVDDLNGNDGNNGSIASPFKTIQAAVNSISDDSAAKPYSVNIAPGVYGEAQVDLSAHTHVSLAGAGKNVTTITNGFTHAPGAANTSAFRVSGLTLGASSIDENNGSNSVIEFLDCFFQNHASDGGPAAGQNYVFYYGCTAQSINVINGQTFIFGTTLTQNLDIQDGDQAAVYFIGSLLLDTALNMFGRANFLVIGSLCLTDVTGTIASATTPTIFGDDSSLNLLGANIYSGDVSINFLNNVYGAKTADYDVRNERLLDFDATAGNLAANLPSGAASRGRIVTIKKTDASANTVTATPFAGDDIEGNPSVALANQWDSVTLMSTGTVSWRILSTT